MYSLSILSDQSQTDCLVWLFENEKFSVNSESKKNKDDF